MSTHRGELRHPQIQYQLLNAQLCIGKSYDSAEDAPDMVNEALGHIQTSQNLVSGAETLTDAQPDESFVPTLESVAYLDVDEDAAYSAMLVGAGEDHDFYVDGSDTPGRYVLVRMPDGDGE